MSDVQPYKHTQRSPLCLVLYATSGMFLVVSWSLHAESVVPLVFCGVGLCILILAASFHHLTVEDEGERLSVSFGPIPLFRRTIAYANIVRVETGRTTLLDGWGIHKSFRGGWVWNLWGLDCVVVKLQKGVLRIGTDDAETLAEYLNRRLPEFQSTDHNRPGSKGES